MKINVSGVWKNTATAGSTVSCAKCNSQGCTGECSGECNTSCYGGCTSCVSCSGCAGCSGTQYMSTSAIDWEGTQKPISYPVESFGGTVQTVTPAAAIPPKINVGGAWKTVSAVKEKVGGTWKTVNMKQ